MKSPVWKPEPSTTIAVPGSPEVGEIEAKLGGTGGTVVVVDGLVVVVERFTVVVVLACCLVVGGEDGDDGRAAEAVVAGRVVVVVAAGLPFDRTTAIATVPPKKIAARATAPIVRRVLARSACARYRRTDSWRIIPTCSDGTPALAPDEWKCWYP